MTDPVFPEPDAGTASAGTPRGSLAKSVAAGASWSAGGQFAKQLISTLRIFLLARLLVPAEFGTLAMVTVFAGVASLIAEAGIGHAVIQRLRVDETVLSTAFWMQLGLTVCAGSLLGLAGPLIAMFYGRPELKGYALALGANFVISGWATVHRSVLARAMRFRTMAIIGIVTTTIGTLIVVPVAFVRRDAWALVIASVVSGFLASVSVIRVSGWNPRFIFDRAVAREILRFTLPLSGFQFVAYAVRNGDNLLVGKFLGATALGLYTRGYQILLFPLRQVAGVVGRVMFPAMSSIQGDLPRMKAAYLRSTAAVALVAFPAMAGLLITADDFVSVLLGPNWSGAVPVVRLFAVVGLLESLSTTVGWIYLSLGRTKLQLTVGLSVAPLIFAGVAVGIFFGTATSVAAGYAVATLLWWYPAVSIPGRLIGLRVRDIAQAVAPIAACASAMALAVLGARWLMEGAQPALRLPIMSALGAALYLALAHFLQLAAYRDLKSVFLRRNLTTAELPTQDE